MKANAVFNGTTGLTTIFSVVLNIRDVLDMALNRTIEFILFVFISITIWVIGHFLIRYFSTLRKNKTLEPSDNTPNSNNRSILIAISVTIFISFMYGLYKFKTTPVNYIVLTDVLTQDECLLFKKKLEENVNSGNIDLKGHTIHLTQDKRQLFLKPPYFTDKYYAHAENEMRNAFKYMDNDTLKIHKSKAFNPPFRKKVKYFLSN